MLTYQMSGLQILAFLSGLAGLGASIGATVSNEWRVTSRASSVITATWVLQGLWNNCAGNAIGALHCRPHHTILQLDGYIQACRGLMIAAVCLGFFGSIFALVGMKCTKIGGTDKNKARIACFAGVDFILSGLCSLSACSLYAHQITSEFFDPMFVAQKFYPLYPRRQHALFLHCRFFYQKPQSGKLYLQRRCLAFSSLLLPERAGKVCKPEAASRLQQLLQDSAL
ncbi:claudin-10-like isoform X3 [Seriola lalandi dorsalis]|uniref:claudin-10-like isoform X3 n=1 Tax=Seriola lalandi dorsalis TaxID=1841481 RepID=UPI000C6F77F6|nr:claudin-10-like isoform X3 [Seriola lalandi dorsalis]